MKSKDIQTIRDSIGKIVNMVTKSSVKVTQRGTKAFVEYDKTGRIVRMNIPVINEGASDALIAGIQGYIDHECGHVLKSDPKALIKAKKAGARVMNMANIIEDIYVEREMSKLMPGVEKNLDAVRRFYLDEVAKPEIDRAMKSGDEMTARGYASVIQFRAWGGQTIAQDFLKDHPEIAKLNEELAARVGDLPERLKSLKNSDACLELAKEFVTAMKGPEAPPPIPSLIPPPPSSSPEDDDSEESGGDHDDGSSEEGEGEEKGEGGTEPEKDSSPSDDEPADDDFDESSDGPAKPEPAPSVEPEESAEPDLEPEAESDPPSRLDDMPSPESEDELASDEDPELGEAEDEAGSSKDLEKDGSGTGDAAGDSDPGADAPGTGPADDAEGTDGEGRSSSPPPEDDLSDMMEESRDFDDSMSKALSDAAKSEAANADYIIYSTDWDEIGVAPEASSPTAVGDMIDSVHHMIAPLQKSLERAMFAKARRTWNPGQRRGRINPGSLFRTSVGDDRVFRKRHETRAKNTAVTLLIDCSASMNYGDRIGTAAKAAYALSETLERLKIKHEVLGFTTRSCGEMVALMEADPVPGGYSRYEALRTLVFKSFTERLTTQARSRIAWLTNGGARGTLRENVDGESLRVAARRLVTQEAERHVLIVLSDGAPACPGDYEALQSHLRKVVKETQEQGVEVVGIGIQTNSVRHFYPKNVVLNDLAQLPLEVMSQIQKILLEA